MTVIEIVDMMAQRKSEIAELRRSLVVLLKSMVMGKKLHAAICVATSVEQLYIADERLELVITQLDDIVKDDYSVSVGQVEELRQAEKESRELLSGKEKKE
jgi:hypothetical protein